MRNDENTTYRKHHHVRLKTFTPFMCHAEYLLKFHENLYIFFFYFTLLFMETTYNLQINNCTINSLIFIFKKKVNVVFCMEFIESLEIENFLCICCFDHYVNRTLKHASSVVLLENSLFMLIYQLDSTYKEKIYQLYENLLQLKVDGEKYAITELRGLNFR